MSDKQVRVNLRIRLVLVAMLAVLAGAGYWLVGRPAPLKPSTPRASLMPEICREAEFESNGYIICDVDPSRYKIGLFLNAPDGKPFHDVKNFVQARAAAGEPVLLAMNAGMYHEDLSPVGLYVSDGIKKANLQTGEGTGNFFLKPNGVFFADKSGKVGLLETERFATLSPEMNFATQSGPMLVIDGALHPKFEPNGVSRNIRNGVGVSADGHALFVISKTQVSFGSFARLFRDQLKCQNALYFDGVVSTLSNGKVNLVGGTYPAGPIVAVTAKMPAATQ